MRTLALLLALSFPALASAQDAPSEHLSPAVTRYVKYDTAKNTLWLDHVRVIDGTGAAPLEDATVVLSTARSPRSLLQQTTSSACMDCPPALHLDLTGHTIFPGLVGMHDHMYYLTRPNLDITGASEPPVVVPEMSFSSPRLYLASGVTTLRTTGSVEPYLDLNLRRAIDDGRIPGPHIDVTGPYLEGPGAFALEMHELKDAADAKPPSTSGPTRASPASRPT